MNKSLIIGLDLSFNSTGITVSYLEDNVGKTIEFFRILFDNETNKTGKRYTPHKIQNVEDIVYIMPRNINIDDLVIDKTDINNIEQCEATLKSMICSKNINLIISNAIEKYKPKEIFCVIENYIMPAFSGKNQLKSVSGLIMLQGFVRELLIKQSINNSIPIKLLTPTPSKIKVFFTKSGNADKLTMLKFFIDVYDGKKLIPGIGIASIGQIDDVIDSFALMMYGYSKILKNKFEKIQVKTN
jgi:hypothetical protein